MTDCYLDDIARSPATAILEPPDGPGTGACGRWSAVGYCDERHSVARTILCRREWCLDCGKGDSDAHKRRWSSWLRKAQQLRYMGYLVVTFPLHLRSQMRTAEGLRSMQRIVTDVLRDEGFDRGLRRWHFFGDESTNYHPHLNYLLDAGRLPGKKLENLKRAIRVAVGGECVINYQYTNVPAKQLHLLQYVTRATFTNWLWFPALSYDLKGFVNQWSWGKWNTPKLWECEAGEDDRSEEVKLVQAGICPSCQGKITWSPKVQSSNALDHAHPRLIGMRYYVMDPGIIGAPLAPYPLPT